MKHALLLLLTILLVTTSTNAQLTDDMEAYEEGSLIFTDHWTDWNGTGSLALYSSSEQAYSGSLSGYIPANGTTDAVLNLGNKTDGNWGIKFMMYIPSGKEAYLNIQGNVPVSSGFYAVGDIFFNKDNNSAGSGYVDYNGPSSDWSFFSFPHDEWFEVIINININNNWQLMINGNVEIDWVHYGRWIADGEFLYSNALGGLDFYSITTNCEYWVDDFDFISGFQTSTISLSEVSDNTKLNLYPNPTSGILNIVSNKDLQGKNYQIITTYGNLVIESKISQNNIDLSNLKPGVYFICINECQIRQKIVVR